MREAVVGQVVRGDHRVPGGDRERVHAHVRLDRHVEPGQAGDLGRACDVRLAHEPVRAHEVELGPVGIEQADGALDDVREEVLGRPDRRQAGGELAKRALGIGPVGDLGLRAGELVDEPGVADGDRGLAREAS